jgi:hypothetical protein
MFISILKLPTAEYSTLVPACRAYSRPRLPLKDARRVANCTQGCDATDHANKHAIVAVCKYKHSWNYTLASDHRLCGMRHAVCGMRHKPHGLPWVTLDYMQVKTTGAHTTPTPEYPLGVL